MQSEELKQYLERIEYQGTLEPTAENLKKLHEGHVFHIPFENINVLQGKSISLLKEDLFQKIVMERRGGYCFEMNGLFSDVLESIGFEVKQLLARVYVPQIGYTAKTHQTLLVKADGREWLCDVGFGGNGLLSPLLFELDLEQSNYWTKSRIVKEPSINGYAYQFWVNGGFQNTYAFTLEESSAMDYELSNHFTSTYPASIFRKVRMINLPNEQGRVSMFDQQLKIVRDAVETIEELQSEQEISMTLTERFGLQ